MRSLFVGICCLILAACSCENCGPRYSQAYYLPDVAGQADYYRPTSYGQVFHVAGFDIREGQQMRDFFDEFEEPMHANYVGDDTVEWTYYVDYNHSRDKGRIVRYCELNDYPPHSLCAIKVSFYLTYVSSATTNCF